MVTIDKLVDIACMIGNKELAKIYVGGPTGVRGRNSDNRLIEEKLGWKPKHDLCSGLTYTYEWIEGQITRRNNKFMKEAITL